MKLLIASDIHGSATWCRALMERIDANAPDRVLLLGDLLYHGPRNDLPAGYAPKQVIEMLNGIATRIVAVRGNCEAEVDQMVLGFPCMAEYAVVMDGVCELYCTHGHLWNPEHLPPLVDGSVFLYGHTHVKRDEVVENPCGEGTVRLFNPGSVSIPKDGSHSFALYENGVFELCEL